MIPSLKPRCLQGDRGIIQAFFKAGLVPSSTILGEVILSLRHRGQTLGISHCPTSWPEQRQSLSSSSHLPNSSPPSPPRLDSRHFHRVTLHSLLHKYKRTQKGCILSFPQSQQGIKAKL